MSRKMTPRQAAAKARSLLDIAGVPMEAASIGIGDGVVVYVHERRWLKQVKAVNYDEIQGVKVEVKFIGRIVPA